MSDAVTTPTIPTTSTESAPTTGWISGIPNVVVLIILALTFVLIVMALRGRLNELVVTIKGKFGLVAKSHSPGLSLQDVKAGKDVTATDATGRGIEAKRIVAEGNASFRTEGNDTLPKA